MNVTTIKIQFDDGSERTFTRDSAQGVFHVLATDSRGSIESEPDEVIDNLELVPLIRDLLGFE